LLNKEAYRTLPHSPLEAYLEEDEPSINIVLRM